MDLLRFAPFVLSFLFQYVVADVASASSRMPVSVNTKSGRIQGYESIFLAARVRSFLSVPFAEPPIEKNRFRPPKPKRGWNGTLETTTLSPACYQGRDNYNVTFWGSEMWNHNTPVSEDCLYMNIWAPADAKNLTVMVWLFGGGYYSGSPSLILYDGKALAAQANVVVININYRVGPFGYLYFDDDDAPGNVGMLDQQLALHWVRENAQFFGGNPARISLFGESAGAASIVAHLIAPGSRGIFKNGILQSGSLDNKWSLDTPQRALEKSREFADLLQCNRTTLKDTIQCLREQEPSALVAQIWNLNLNFLEFPFVIVSKDKNFFRDYDAFDALRQGLYRKDVNLMIGINHDEGNFWNIYNLPKYFDVSEHPKLSIEDFNDCVEKAFAAQPEVVRNSAKFVYLEEDLCKNNDGKSTFLAEQVNQMVGDYFFTCDSLWLADQMADGPGEVYIYYFDQKSSANPWPKWTGVMHGYEIEFVFGVPTYNTSVGYTTREKTFSNKIIQYWSSFATDGVPRLRKQSHSNQPVKTDAWPAYHPEKSNKWMYLQAGSHIRPMTATKKKECKMWRNARDIEYLKYANGNSSAAATSRSLFTMTSLILFLASSSILVLH